MIRPNLLSLTAAAVLALAPGGASWAAKSCTIAVKGDSPVAKACQEGGIDAAKKVMKSLRNEARDKGMKVDCDTCHRNEDNWALTDQARDQFRKMLEVTGKAPAPAKPMAPPAAPDKAFPPGQPPGATKSPDPAKPSEAAKPPEPAKPSEAAKPPEPAKPPEATKTSEPPAKGTKKPAPAKPAKRGKKPAAKPASAPAPAADRPAPAK
jgi:hypothetical protein